MGNKYVIHLLAFIFVTCSVDEVICAIHGEQGSSIILDPHIRGELEKLTWTHNGNNVVEYDQKQFLIFEPFKKRVVLNIQSGQLTIKKLKPEDSGVYESTAITNGKPLYSKHDLQVFESVPQPRVTCKQEDPESEVATLLCSVDLDTPVRYRWRGPTVYDHPGPELQLDRQKDTDSVFTCLVKNEVSEKQTTFSLRDCQPGGVASGIIAVIALAAICVLFMLILIPLLICRERQKKELAKKNLVHEHVNIENGERRNLLSPEEATDEDTDEGGKNGKSRGLHRGVLRNPKRGSDLEDAENGTSFSLRATLPSHAKLRPRAGDEQANGTCEAKDLNSPDKAITSGLHQEDERSQTLTHDPVEVVTLDQKAPEDHSNVHGAESTPAVLRDFPLSSEDPDTQRDTVNDNRDQLVDEELPRCSPEDVVAEVKPIHPHNLTGITDGERKKCSEEEEGNVSDGERDTDLMPDSGLEDEDGNENLQTDKGNGQEGVDVQAEKVEEDNGTCVQENHDLSVEQSCVLEEMKAERVYPDKTEEDFTDVVQPVQKELMDEAEMDHETKMREKDRGSDVEVEEEEKEEKDDNITTKEQPPTEEQQGVCFSGLQEKMEHEDNQGQTRDGGEQDRHANEDSDGRRSTGEHEIEGAETESETKHNDENEGESKSGTQQGGSVEHDTNQSEGDEKPGQEQNELGQEERPKTDEETEDVNSKLEDQVLQQANDNSLEEHPTDCQHVSVMDEMNDKDSVIKSQNKAQEQEEQNPLKEEDDHSISTEEPTSIDEQGSHLPDIKTDQHVSVTDTISGQDHEVRSEFESTENNIQLEEKNEDEKAVRQEEEQSIPATEPAASKEEDSCSPEDHRSDKVISDEEDDGKEEDRTQDDHEQDENTETIHNQDKDFLEKTNMQDQLKEQEEKNNRNSIVVPEGEAGLEPEKKEEEMTAVMTDTERQSESNQGQERQTSEPTKPDSDGEGDVEQSGPQAQDKDHKDLKDEESENEGLKSDKEDEEKSAVPEPQNESNQEQENDTSEPAKPASDGEGDMKQSDSKPQDEDHKLKDESEKEELNYTNRPAVHEDVPEKKDEKITAVTEPENESKKEQERDTSEPAKPTSDEEGDVEQSGLQSKDEDHKDLNDEESEKEELKSDKEDEGKSAVSEAQNESDQEQERDTSELAKHAPDGEEDSEPPVQLQDEAPAELKDEEQGKEEQRGQTDSLQLQDQPLTEELAEKQNNTNVSACDVERGNECDSLKADMDLAKEKTEGDAETNEDGKVEGGAQEDNADQVKGKANPPVSDAKVTAVDEKEHSVAEDQTAENARDPSETEGPTPAQEKEAEQRQEEAQEDGQQNDAHNCNSDENKSAPRDDEINLNKEPVKTLLDEDRGDTELHPKQTDAEQLHSEVPGQLQTEQNHMDDQDEERISDEEQPPEENQKMRQVDQPSSKNGASDRGNDKGIVEPKQTEEKSASQSEKEKKEEVERERAEMHERDPEQRRAGKVMEVSEVSHNQN
ncbi:hypothetical protein ACEWY4_023436 [Coilia grayii]|uniref:Ig-like domain-containing protein n=1 Tax=Coilia grayii TaxID=363190 RepID=A0ABD1J316_9TELE